MTPVQQQPPPAMWRSSSMENLLLTPPLDHLWLLKKEKVEIIMFGEFWVRPGIGGGAAAATAVVVVVVVVVAHFSFYGYSQSIEIERKRHPALLHLLFTELSQ